MIQKPLSFLLASLCALTLGCSGGAPDSGDDDAFNYRKDLDPGWKGVVLQYRVAPARPGDPTMREHVERSRSILEERLASASVEGARVVVSGPDTVDVLVPDDVWNLTRVKRLAEIPGHLSFHVVVARPGLAGYDHMQIKDYESPGANLRVLRDPRGVIPREEIGRVSAIQDPAGKPALGIELTDQGRRHFARLSQRFEQDYLAINLDGTAIMIAKISGRVQGDLMVAWDQFTSERVAELESVLNVPRLPTGLILVSEEEIGGVAGGS